jgi:hypothetical protein
MEIRFADHSSFQRAAAGMVGGATLFGLALHPLTPLAPIAGGLVGVAAGAAIGYGKVPWRIGAALVAMIPMFLLSPSPLMVGLIAATMGLALAGGRGLRGLAIVIAGAMTSILAMWTAARIGHAEQTAHWPAWATVAASSAALGMVGVLALLPRHLRFVSDPVRAALKTLPANLDAEVRQLCERGVAIWTATAERLGADDPGVELVRDGVVKTLEVAASSATADVSASADAELAKRIADLDARIIAATDTEVRTQYQSARAALDDQRRYRDRIRQSRERLVARLHNHVAALEKFQLAATGLTSTTPAMRQLEDLSHEVAASGEALGEVAIAADAPAA